MALRIAIVGGGLAGLATAAALAHFGIEAEVFEQTPTLGEIGAGVNVSPQAIMALRAIGLGDKIGAVANVAPGTLTRDMNTGAQLDYRDQTSVAARFGAGIHTFHRADLLQALASGVDPHTIHLDYRLVGIEERPGAVKLAFANGAARDTDLVIGADGVRSLLRRTLYGDDSPTYTGQMVWRALLPGSEVPAAVMAPSGHVQWLGSGRHFFAYYLRGRDVVNIVTQEDTDQWVEEGWSIPGDPDDMRASFPDPEPLLATLLDRVTQCSKWGLFTRPLTDNWGRGGIALIGDAAHAMLPNAGQGASQSFEDAYILARWLAAGRTDPISALQSFRRVRIPRVHGVQQISAAIVRAKHKYDLKSAKAMPAKIDAVDRMSWIWGYDVATEWNRPPAVPAFD
ncbi:MAG TPA: FAD-dependent monooxygenase [Xanthobacteraceae bacterium]|jgi:salicylate hydroxylase|nr:FAD-dependent monooxygenase [Xanthobacteraceae bacterium]